MTPSKQRANGRRQFTLGISLYVITLIVQVLLFKPPSQHPVVAVAFAALPVGFALWAMWGWVGAVRNFDELQRKTFGEAGLIALGATIASTFTYGFFETYLGAPMLSMFTILPLVAGAFVLALIVVGKRYQ